MEIESLLYISEKNSCTEWLVNLCWLSDLVWQKLSKDKQRLICFILYVRSLVSIKVLFSFNDRDLKLPKATFYTNQMNFLYVCLDGRFILFFYFSALKRNTTDSSSYATIHTQIGTTLLCICTLILFSWSLVFGILLMIIISLSLPW